MANESYPNCPASREIATVFEHATRLATPVEAPPDMNGIPVMVVPLQYKLEPVPGWRPDVPYDIKAKFTTTHLESFLSYLGDFASTSSRVFVRAGLKPSDGLHAECIIDYHTTDGGARWCQHVAIWSPVSSVQWSRWTSFVGQPKLQRDFAEFLEDNQEAIVEPTGADLLTMVNHLKVDGAITYNKAQVLTNGNVSLTYVDQRKATSGISDAELPTRLLLSIPVVHRGPRFSFDLKLRYRLDPQGQLFLTVLWPNVETVWQAAVDDAVKVIINKAKCPCVIGTLQ